MRAPAFVADEDAISLGARIMSAVLLDALRERDTAWASPVNDECADGTLVPMARASSKASRQRGSASREPGGLKPTAPQQPFLRESSKNTIDNTALRT